LQKHVKKQHPKLAAVALASKSESFRKLNPHIFGVGAMATRCAEQPALRALDQSKPQRAKGKGPVEIRVQCIALRHRLLDPDAVAYSMKPLTDAIADTLGVDDADPRVHWEWSQAPTGGQEGVIVKIQELNPTPTRQGE
jgi:hypothetical protein